jgi:4-amino-4-deoxy-L-arabinose transferase-like glycosyltransferase
MSRDLEIWLQHPTLMMWDDNQVGDIDQFNRAIGAPLTKYIIGISRLISKYQSPIVDWDWSLSWDENELAGALPSQNLLTAVRFSLALLNIASIVWIYLSGKLLINAWGGILAALFLGTNTLILLHGRRSMAESALIFGTSLAILGILLGDQKPWLAGLGVAVAYNAKQSALPLILVGLLAICWLPNKQLLKKHFWSNVAQYLGVFILLTLLLNPILWSNPIGVFFKSFQSRQNFLFRQIDTSRALVPEQVMENPLQRSAVMLANLYILPPSFYEVGNYIEETAMSESRYLSIPGHNLFRGLIGGGIALSITLFGMISAALSLIKVLPEIRRRLLLLFIGTFVQAAALVVAIPLPYQRYVIPMVPFISLWIGYGLSQIILKATTQS